jgi:hypothetical protein
MTTLIDPMMGLLVAISASLAGPAIVADALSRRTGHILASHDPQRGVGPHRSGGNRPSARTAEAAPAGDFLHHGGGHLRREDRLRGRQCLTRCKLRASDSERWLRRVFDEQLGQSAGLDAVPLSDHRQREVASRGDPAAARAVAVDDDASVSGIAPKALT